MDCNRLTSDSYITYSGVTYNYVDTDSSRGFPHKFKSGSTFIYVPADDDESDIPTGGSYSPDGTNRFGPVYRYWTVAEYGIATKDDAYILGNCSVVPWTPSSKLVKKTEVSGCGTSIKSSAESDYTDTQCVKYKDLQLRIDFILNGIGGSNYYDMVTRGTAISEPIPTASGYTFDGWYTDPDFSGDRYSFYGVRIVEPKTFYAKWIGEDVSIGIQGKKSDNSSLIADAFTCSCPSGSPATFKWGAGHRGGSLASVPFGSTTVKTDNTIVIKHQNSTATDHVVATITAKPSPSSASGYNYTRWGTPSYGGSGAIPVTITKADTWTAWYKNNSTLPSGVQAGYYTIETYIQSSPVGGWTGQAEFESNNDSVHHVQSIGDSGCEKLLTDGYPIHLVDDNDDVIFKVVINGYCVKHDHAGTHYYYSRNIEGLLGYFVSAGQTSVDGHYCTLELTAADVADYLANYADYSEGSGTQANPWKMTLMVYYYGY